MFAYAGNNPIKYTDPDGKSEKIVFSLGHGVLLKDSKGNLYESTRLRGPVNGYWEISHIYNFQKYFLPALNKLGVDVTNIKAPPYNAYTAGDKVKASNKIDADGSVDLHVAVHADARGKKGFDGITVIYMDDRPISKKIAQYFVNKLTEAGFEAKLFKESQTAAKRLTELHDTTAPAVYFEIGNMESDSGLAKLLDMAYMKKLAETIANAIASFGE